MIRKAKAEDIESLVQLSHTKRKQYEKEQQLFWKEAKNSNNQQKKYFKSLLYEKNTVILVYEDKKNILGFVIGSFRVPPAVYDTSLLTLYVDDFCVDITNWNDVGGKLLTEIISVAKKRKALFCTLQLGEDHRLCTHTCSTKR